MDTMAAFAMGEASKGNRMRVFDWDKAATLIKANQPKYAAAGLEGDWGYTGGTIYSEGKPDLESYTFLASTWATPELEMDDSRQPCWKYADECEWDSGTKWPDSAIAILNAK